jgi:hypothetical protein
MPPDPPRVKAALHAAPELMVRTPSEWSVKRNFPGIVHMPLHVPLAV